MHCFVTSSSSPFGTSLVFHASYSHHLLLPGSLRCVGLFCWFRSGVLTFAPCPFFVDDTPTRAIFHLQISRYIDADASGGASFTFPSQYSPRKEVSGVKPHALSQNHFARPSVIKKYIVVPLKVKTVVGGAIELSGQRISGGLRGATHLSHE